MDLILSTKNYSHLKSAIESIAFFPKDEAIKLFSNIYDGVKELRNKENELDNVINQSIKKVNEKQKFEKQREEVRQKENLFDALYKS